MKFNKRFDFVTVQLTFVDLQKWITAQHIIDVYHMKDVTHENSKNPTKTQMNEPKNVLNPAETSPK